MNQMRHSVLIVVNSLLEGGAEKQAVLLSCILHKRYKVVVLVWNGHQTHQKHLEALRTHGIAYHLLRGNLIKKSLGILNILYDRKISIIFSYLLTSNLITGIVGQVMGIPHTFSGIRSSYLPPRKLHYQRFIHNHLTTHAIVNSYKGYQYLSARGFRMDNMHVLHNGIENLSPPIVRNFKKRVNILSVGRFDDAKDYFTALRSIKILREKRSDFLYTIIGWGGLEHAIKNEVKKLHLDNCVLILTGIDDMEPYYIESDIYLSTSIYEGFSNSLLEATAYSLPLVATNVGDNKKIILHNKSGYLAPVRNEVVISEYLLSLLNDQEMRNEFGLKGYNHQNDMFSIEVFQKNYFKLISSLN
jgi:glycosyltransferase involved in cell wall biosynthesis